MAIVAISTAPAGIAGTSMSEYVAEAEKVLRADGRVKYQLGAMFTTIEGELHVCMEVCEKMHMALIDAGAPRVGTVIKIDDRRDKPTSMEAKVKAVEDKLAS